jgi:uncharacterized protein (DUF58 family)
MVSEVEVTYPDALDIQNLKSYELLPRLLVEGYLQGRHRSPQIGQSTEFRDFRPYAPGDDLRMMDWKVYARTDRHVVRMFEEETDLMVYTFLDSSASMGFGQPQKIRYASLFAAALSYLTIRQGDRASLLTFDGEIRKYHPPGGTQQHLKTICNTLQENVAGSETSLATALRRAFPLCRKRGTLIIVSDFMDDVAELFAALDQYVNRNFEVVLFHVLSPEELELSRGGVMEYQDLETGEKLIANSNQLSQRYREGMHEFIANMRSLAVRRRVEYILADTTVHYFKLFDKYLKRKVR